MNLDLREIPCFGVAGNFTGHLEQAGEALDFSSVKTLDAKAPKAVFPTYIPLKYASSAVPEFLTVFPFDDGKIIFPKGEEKIQIEPECALICNLEWENGFVKNIVPFGFAASNDVSIRKQGASKISQKKNWGRSSKGLSMSVLGIENFSEGCILDYYRIASFLCRGESIYEYGEDSSVKSYSYFYKKLLDWVKDRLNFQADENPCENIHSYFIQENLPAVIMISVGATRYTDFGENNFLQNGDFSIVTVYDERLYSHQDIQKNVLSKSLFREGISALVQEVIL